MRTMMWCLVALSMWLIPAGMAEAAGAPVRTYPVPVTPASTPATLAPGSVFTYRVVVRNRARRTTSAARVAVYLAPDAGRSRGARLAQAALRPLRPGRTAAVQARATVPAGTAPGAYRVLTCIVRGTVVPPRRGCIAARTAVRVAPPVLPAVPPALPAPVAPPATAPAPAPVAPPVVPPVVPPVNAAPVAADDAEVTDLELTRTVAAPGVLANDTDAEGDALVASVVDQPTDGTLTLRSDGGFTYVPDAGFVGTDSFTYRASDGTDTSAPATVTIRVRGADLAATISADETAPVLGDTVTFSVGATNAGPDAADGVEVDVPLPAGLAFVSGPAGYDAATGTWDAGTIAPGATTSGDVVATVGPAARPTAEVTATVSGGPGDVDAADDDDAVTLTPVTPVDLDVDAVVDVATPDVGELVTYTVTARNIGTYGATSVALDALVPSGLSFQSAVPSQGAFDAATGRWSVGSVAPAAAPTLAIRARVVVAGPQAITGTLASVAERDVAAANDIAGATATPKQADLGVEATVSDPSPSVGSTFQMTTQVTNAGPDAATGVRVDAAVPAGATFVSASPSQGSYDPGTGAWIIGTLVDGAAATLTITATYNATSAFTPAIAAASAFDPVGSDNADVATAGPDTDPAVRVAASTASAEVGDLVTFTVTAENASTQPVTGYAIDASVPVGMTFVSATPAQGVYDPATGRWTVGGVAPGAQPTLTLVTRIVSATTQTLAATIVAADQFDRYAANNAALARVVVRRADLGLSSALSGAAPAPGRTVTLTVALASTGPNTAAGVQVAAPLPAGLTFVSAATDQGAYDPATGTWTAGTVVSGMRARLRIVATFTAASSFTASLASSSTFDPDPGNNATSLTVG